jgi:MazG family protein
MTDAAMMDAPDPAVQLARLRAIMHRLRAPGGCPWDAEQTHESLIPNLIEEAYETVDAIQRADFPHLREELGDLLLQVVFHSELAEEAGHFNLDDVAREISDKLVRRHPHVFGDSAAATSDAVLQQWDQIKRGEKGDEEMPFLHGVGKGLPALLRAVKLQKKAAKVGFDWPDETGVVEKLTEEMAELREALALGEAAAVAEEMGDVLFSLVNLARFRKLDPELLMAAANAKFETRFAAVEQGLKTCGLSLDQATPAEMEAEWERAKTAPSRVPLQVQTAC